MDVIEIAGAQWLRDEGDGCSVLATVVSQDRAWLACILHRRDGFQVERFLRGHMLPQWQGEWWLSQPQRSLTDTEPSARALAMEWTRAGR